MSAMHRLRPEALLAGFGIAVFLGFGSGYFIGDLRESDASATPPTTSAPTTTEASSRTTQSSALPVRVNCRVQGTPPELARPAFVAGVVDGGVGALADAFEVADRVAVERRSLNDTARREDFSESVLAKQRNGRGVVLLQKGRAQQAMAGRFAAEGVAVVVVFPASTQAAPMDGYPSGTLGVFTSATSEVQATLTASEAEDVVRVLRDRVPCPSEQVERNVT